MYCPICTNTLQQLDVTTNSGGKFAVDHCGYCGGTWFDPYEINRIPFHEVNRLAHITVLPKKPILPSREPKCPRCHKNLIFTQFESAPSGLRFLRCTHCKGIFATQKALEEFKKNQEETINEYKIKQVAFPSLSVVFAPALFVMLLLFGTFLTINNLSQSKDERIRAAQMINNVYTEPLSPTQSAVVFTTEKPYRSSIIYGISQLDMTTRQISLMPSTNHKIILSNLKADTVYFYRIILIDDSGNKIFSGLSVFTQAAP